MNYSSQKKIMINTIIQKRESMSTINQKTTISLRLKHIVTAAMMLILTTMALDMQAQCGNSALVCNNLVRVSLDTSCTAVITPDVVLKDLNIDTSFYYVEVYDPNGVLIPGDTIRQDYNGAKLEVRVYCKSNNLYCWGNIIIEDKIPPEIEITPCDTILSCIVMPFELDPNSLVSSVSFTDNGCTKPDTFSITDFTETVFPCRDTVKIIKRVFSTTDAAGNTASKTQTIYLLRGELKEIVFPKDTIIDCLDEADLSSGKLGEPQVGSCDHFEINMQDVDIPVCGVSRKVLRRWTITDNCSNKDTVVTQTIYIKDQNAPKFSDMNFEIPVDKIRGNKFNCTADVIGINNPQITDCNLAQTTLRIFYQMSDEAGNLSGPLVASTINTMLSDPDDPNTATMIWDLNDIPVEESFRVIFVADDGCGNISRDTSMVFRVPDTIAPNAVCEGNTTVVLNTDGVTEVLAESFDDNSFDNCGIFDKKVRRFNTSCAGFASDTEFGDSVHFCCDDIANNPIKVVFRVFDEAGGFSDCIVNVIVQDKRPVTLVCGPDLRFNCGDDSTAIVNTILLNPPTVTYVCGEKSLTPDIPNWNVSECGGASFDVVWTAMDLNGQMATCTQNVLIGNLVDATVTRPNLTITLGSCAAGTHPDDIPNSRPIVNDVDCENIAITWEDEILEGTGAECIKILRTWAVIDWCQFDGGNIASGILDQFEQTLLISDDVRPVIDCAPIGIVADDADLDCQESVTVRISATDDCTPNDLLVFVYEVDLDADGSADETGEGSSVTFLFPVGSHSVIFTVSDACGNVERCTTPVTVTSSKEPFPLCVGLTEAAISTSGTASVNAADLNVKSTTGCSLLEDGLSFSFSETEDVPTMTFNCDDIANGIFDEVILQVWVTDDATGARAACDVIVTISDRQNDFCSDVAGASALSGVVSDEDAVVVKEIPVMLENMSTGIVISTMTDDEGFYSFDNIVANETYKVNPQFEDYPLAGISTLDIVLIQQHILGLRNLDSPYKLHAADVNNSSSISALDLVALRLLILGRTDRLPNDNWKFFDKDFEFDMVNDPWSYNNHIMIQDASSVETNKNFIGVKVGDVNGNAFGALATGSAGPRSTSQFNVSGVRNGNVTRYTFSSDEKEAIFGLQLALDLDPSMELVIIGSDHIDIGSNNFSEVDGALRISWTSDVAIDLKNKDLFFIDVKSNSSSIQELRLAKTDLNSELYSENLESSGIVLNNEIAENVAGFQLYQNQPNPFTDQTKISFYLPEGDHVVFTIADLSGKNVYQSNSSYNKGKNTINITSSDLGANGVYYYTVTTSTSKETKRMIVLH